ncbi:hypothetical protein TVAG_125990 [Trichomonas vaginalis G3]|uniref:Uncharacterized protein n=1 Tax=Trichomonas vaginalis (strain ATCC PRA-98 / G3) TaxID=412133 RepID=A2ECY8_TRIV3|nr:hypothetical protein TVAGG3_0860900 [Trichomonas vaginalis G3]EAY09439.1 hypothetical protein TVAG_125990 [Trichomonas vaginalis G3]KAI5500665.1 hypothetical protein TVAGG3_0860900 [Trichomonas vaginalis G3]|eukprot:XP_001321662.1 hypothetical protein [Trichomonas vaginalis G3]
MTMITLPKLRPSISQVETLLSQPSPKPRQIENELNRISPKIIELTNLIDKLFSQIPSNISDEFEEMKTQIELAKKRGKYTDEREYIDSERLRTKGKFEISVALEKENIEKDVEFRLNQVIYDAQQKSLEIPENKDANRYNSMKQQIAQYILQINSKINNLELKMSGTTLNESKIPYWQIISDTEVKSIDVKNSISMFETFMNEIEDGLKRIQKLEALPVIESTESHEDVYMLPNLNPKLDNINSIIDEQSAEHDKMLFEVESKLMSYENRIKSLEDESSEILQSLSSIADKTAEQQKSLNSLDSLIEEITKSMHNNIQALQIKSTYDNFSTKIKSIESEIEDMSLKLKRVSLELPLISNDNST